VFTRVHARNCCERSVVGTPWRRLLVVADAQLLGREALHGMLLRSLKAKCVVAVVVPLATAALFDVRASSSAVTFSATALRCDIGPRHLRLFVTRYVTPVSRQVLLPTAW
jgi:hypothetical protein